MIPRRGNMLEDKESPFDCDMDYENMISVLHTETGSRLAVAQSETTYMLSGNILHFDGDTKV